LLGVCRQCEPEHESERKGDGFHGRPSRDRARLYRFIQL
jgi:hypothetical protein